MISQRFSLQRLKVPSSWCVHRIKFYSLSPELAVSMQRKFPTENYFSYYFDHELLYLEYGKNREYELTLSWVDPSSPDGRYMLSLSNVDWSSEKVANLSTDEKIKIIEDNIKLETRSLEKATTAVNEMMLKISLENGDYPNYPTGLQLQEFTPNNYIYYAKHEFFDLEPDAALSTDKWQLFKERMFVVQPFKGSDWLIEAGWFPAFDPNGSYRVKVSLESLGETLLEEFESKSKAETVEYINNVFDVQLKKLYETHGKREKSDKERKRQARLREQRDLRA